MIPSIQVELVLGENISGRSKPGDCAVADVIASCNVRERLTGLSPPECFPILMGRQFWLSTQTHPLCNGPRSSFAGTRTNKIPLELRQSPQNRHHETSVRGGGIGPTVA